MWHTLPLAVLAGPAYHLLASFGVDHACYLAPSLLPRYCRATAQPADVALATGPISEGVTSRRLMDKDQIKQAFLEQCQADGTPKAECLEGAEMLLQNLQTLRIVSVVMSLATILVPVLVAVFYKSKVTDRRPMPFPDPSNIPPQYSLAQPPHEFRPTLFSCCDNMNLCLCSLCFPMVRLGDTFAAAQVTGYWMPTAAAFVVAALIWLKDIICGLMGIKLGTWVDAIIQACFAYVLATWRGGLRQKMGSPENPQSKLPADMAVMCCCQPCANAQMAAAVDDSTGVTVGCPCNLQMKGNPLVGMPVQLQP